MKTAEFNKDYSIDTTTKRGVRAHPKSLAALPTPQVETADGEVFSPENVYFFFDESTRQVRQSRGLRQVECLYLGSFGLRIIEIAKLRNNRDDALADGQEFLRNRINELNSQIGQFELEKSPESRSLKDYLMAKDAVK